MCLRRGCATVALSEDTRLVSVQGQDMYTCRQLAAARDNCVDEHYGYCIFCEVACYVNRQYMLNGYDYVNDLRINRSLLDFLVAGSFDSRLVLGLNREAVAFFSRTGRTGGRRTITFTAFVWTKGFAQFYDGNPFRYFFDSSSAASSIF